MMIIGSIVITAIAEKVKHDAKLDTPVECPVDFVYWTEDKQIETVRCAEVAKGSNCYSHMAGFVRNRKA